jgi:hypothetical protein
MSIVTGALTVMSHCAPFPGYHCVVDIGLGSSFDDEQSTVARARRAEDSAKSTGGGGGERERDDEAFNIDSG